LFIMSYIGLLALTTWSMHVLRLSS
jgi:hypothetical protein